MRPANLTKTKPNNLCRTVSSLYLRLRTRRSSKCADARRGHAQSALSDQSRTYWQVRLSSEYALDVGLTSSIQLLRGMLLTGSHLHYSVPSRCAKSKFASPEDSSRLRRHAWVGENDVRNLTIKGLAFAAAGFLFAFGLAAKAHAQLPGPVLWTYYETLPDVSFTFDPADPPGPSPTFILGIGAGDNILRLENPNGNANVALPGAPQNICAMLYVFDDDEEMGACCGCPVSSAGLATFSVEKNLTFELGPRGRNNRPHHDRVYHCGIQRLRRYQHRSRCAKCGGVVCPGPQQWAGLCQPGSGLLWWL